MILSTTHFQGSHFLWLFQDNSTEEEIWKEGFAVCFTAGIPSVIKELCFLCGSKGNEKVLEAKA